MKFNINELELKNTIKTNYLSFLKMTILMKLNAP